MNEEVYPRADQQLNPAVFDDALKVIIKYQWLYTAGNAFARLWNLCGSNSQRDLLEDLLEHFTYVDNDALGEMCDACVNHVVGNWGLESSNTLFIAIADNSYADGSHVFLQALRHRFPQHQHWKEHNFVSRIGDGVAKADTFSNLVLIDDFIGTGKTLVRRYSWFANALQNRGHLNGKAIYVMSMAGMEFAKALLNENSITYFVSMWLKKGIRDHYRKEALDQAISDMTALESHLKSKVGKRELATFSFGYAQSEALYALANFSVPNNVFPIFWWPELKSTTDHCTIFQRSL